MSYCMHGDWVSISVLISSTAKRSFFDEGRDPHYSLDIKIRT